MQAEDTLMWKLVVQAFDLVLTVEEIHQCLSNVLPDLLTNVQRVVAGEVQ